MTVDTRFPPFFSSSPFSLFLAGDNLADINMAGDYSATPKTFKLPNSEPGRRVVMTRFNLTIGSTTNFRIDGFGSGDILTTPMIYSREIRNGISSNAPIVSNTTLFSLFDSVSQLDMQAGNILYLCTINHEVDMPILQWNVDDPTYSPVRITLSDDMSSRINYMSVFVRGRYI